MKLLQGESIVLESDKKILTLTNKRVRYYSKSIGRECLTSIMLEHVSGCYLVRGGQRLFLFLSLICLVSIIIASTALSEHHLLYIFILATVLFAGYYFQSIKKYLVIASSGSKIRLMADKLTTDNAVEFIDTLEELKSKL